MRLVEVATPETNAALAANQVARRYCSSALYAHSVRSYLWGVAYSRRRGLAIDHELLYVASMLHDLALTPPFDTCRTPFDEAAGELAWVFAAAAGWPDVRRTRVARVIARHRRATVGAGEDAEGDTLAVATLMDHTGLRMDLVPTEFQADVASAWPRLNLDAEFAECLRVTAEHRADNRAGVVRDARSRQVRNHELEESTHPQQHTKEQP